MQMSRDIVKCHMTCLVLRHIFWDRWHFERRHYQHSHPSPESLIPRSLRAHHTPIIPLFSQVWHNFLPQNDRLPIISWFYFTQYLQWFLASGAADRCIWEVSSSLAVITMSPTNCTPDWLMEEVRSLWCISISCAWTVLVNSTTRVMSISNCHAVARAVLLQLVDMEYSPSVRTVCPPTYLQPVHSLPIFTQGPAPPFIPLLQTSA